MDSEAQQSGNRVGVGDLFPSQGRVQVPDSRREGYMQSTMPKSPSNRSAFFSNPLFVPDPGKLDPIPVMSATNDGGEKGGSGEEPTHPKSLGGRMLLLKDKPADGDQYVVEEVSSSNWHAPILEGLGADEEDLIGGEVDMEDDVFIEDDPDEVPAAEPLPWRLHARYVGQNSPSAETLKEHFKKVWRLRTGVIFAPIKPKWFTVTLFSEGDYNFVINGGPWVHLGNALLVKAMVGAARPSETDLTTIPLWVKIFDVPWDKQTDANGRKWGRKLGKVLEVEADPLGTKFRDFLRVRIEIPIDRRLQTKITTGVKERPETHQSYLLRYERVPYFCFWCGFIGHNDTTCEKKRIGVPSLAYDASLRTSPMRKFEYREAYEPPVVGSAVKKGLDFSVSDDNSGTLGQPKSRNRNRPVYRKPVAVMPEEIGARDGFEAKEQQGDKNTDRDLAVMLQALRVQYPKESLTEIRERCWNHLDKLASKGEMKMPVLEDISQQNKVPAVLVQPIAMVNYPGRFGTSDMIPALRGLSSWAPSESSADTNMEVSSVLGKRLASDTEEETKSHDQSKALTLHSGEEGGKFQKRGRVVSDRQGNINFGPMEGVEVVEAISHGAADQLTGSQDATRQQQ
ncbi:hypothetical protein QYE76_028111 [Lolium multiflorum]|uniref:Zinc knuckle CX2CX4HX4C domain-containing protein n=1 Tax=Lolium multiflorum TaxID=4521 RepID=A0AAD8QNW1_LOLMU|nr:hypothetical protein QYE76_028111 [Lolium multiflorum]